LVQRSDVDRRAKNYAAKQRVSDYELIPYDNIKEIISNRKGEIVFSSSQRQYKYSPKPHYRAGIGNLHK
jgi:hypothetical protein